jgi:hypothetical protein
MKERTLALKQQGHEQPHRFCDQQDDAEEDENLEDSVGGHRTPQNFSGRNMAQPRYTSSSTDTMPEIK